jgi:hypothetical protein
MVVVPALGTRINSFYAREKVRSPRSHLAALENLPGVWQGSVRGQHHTGLAPHEALPSLLA